MVTIMAVMMIIVSKGLGNREWPKIAGNLHY